MRRFVLACVFLLLAGCTSRTMQNSVNEIGPGSAISGQNIIEFKAAADEADEPKAYDEGAYNFTNVTSGNGSLIVYYFYSSGCSACQALGPEIEKLEDGYPHVLFIKYDLATLDGSAAYRAFSKEKNLSTSQMYVPQVLVNGTIITDRFNINDSLEGIIAASSASG